MTQRSRRTTCGGPTGSGGRVSRGTGVRRTAAAVAAMALTMAGVWSGAAPAGAATTPAGTAASGDVTTGQQNNMRTAWDPAEPALTQPAVSASNFGQLFSTQLNGQVYAQPLVVRSHVIAATETNWVYGLDSATGAIKWSRQVGPDWTHHDGAVRRHRAGHRHHLHSRVRPATDAVYFTAKINDGGRPTTPNWYVHAVDPATGAERAGWPVRLGGSPSNDPTRVFNAETAAQRPGPPAAQRGRVRRLRLLLRPRPYVGYVVGRQHDHRPGDRDVEHRERHQHGRGWHLAGRRRAGRRRRRHLLRHRQRHRPAARHPARPRRPRWPSRWFASHVQPDGSLRPGTSSPPPTTPSSTRTTPTWAAGDRWRSPTATGQPPILISWSRSARTATST